MSGLSKVVKNYMDKTTGLKKFCDRCLKTERWGGNVVLMVVDAAFDSIGLNYFNSIVPKVVEFEEAFVESGEVECLADLANLSRERVENIWSNDRSWNVAFSVASFLDNLGQQENLDDKASFRKWASESTLEGWRNDPIAKIRGVGLTTYQYLRMMGGVDTSMPDKIVRRVIEEILEKTNESLPTGGDVELVRTIETISKRTGYRPIEICWMTWLVQSEGEKIRMEKYRDVLDRI